MNRYPRNLYLAVGAALVVLVAGSVAWACTGSVSITLSPSSGPIGSDVFIQGGRFQAGAPVEIHWGSMTGPVIGTAEATNGISFSVKAKVPDVPAGVYPIVALQRDAAGAITGKAPQAFQVTATGSPSRSTVSSDLWQAYSGQSPALEAGSPESSSSPSGAGSLGVALGAALAGFGVVLATAGLALALPRTNHQPATHKK